MTSDYFYRFSKIRNGKCPKSLRSGHVSGIFCENPENNVQSRFFEYFSSMEKYWN